jgi:hypothetical protein
MPYVDPDNPNPALVNQLLTYYEDSARRLRDTIIHPPGKSLATQEFNQARAAQLLAQVQREIDHLKIQATRWAGDALTQSLQKGIAVADYQAKVAGAASLSPQSSKLDTSVFSVVDRRAVEVLAQDTVNDLHKAADSMGRTASTLLRKMAATKVTRAQVNAIVAGRHIIEGQTTQAARELKDLFTKVYGEQVTIIDKNGDPRSFDVKYYAKMVAQNKAREATCMARHDRLSQRGIDTVVIIGRVSKNFCTCYLGKCFSISGEHSKYPPLSSLPSGGPPFHPFCSKSTAAFIPDLASSAALRAAAPDARTAEFLGTNDTAALQRQFQESHLKGSITKRNNAIVDDIRARARAAGFEPPPYGGKS